MGRVEQPNTHPRCETTEIFQQDGRKVTTQTSSLYLPALITCV